MIFAESVPENGDNQNVENPALRQAQGGERSRTTKGGEEDKYQNHKRYMYSL